MSQVETQKFQNVPLLIGGRWESSRSDRWGDVFNPSTGQVIARAPLCSADETTKVVEAAAAALPAWAATPVVERARVMFRFRALLESHVDELTSLVTREHGKTTAEARAEVIRGLEMVEFSCGIPSLIMGQLLPNIAAEVDSETMRHPVGVCVGITPCNFPAMIPLWMFPVALVCGNTFVLKPSERVPLSAVRLGELLLEAGMPEGIFNIVHGDRECVETLLTHPQVDAVSFVGSTAVAKQVYATGTAHGKRVQAAGGAKNHIVIMPDADINLVTQALAASAYGCSGQRCMAGSVAVPVGKVADPLIDQLAQFASDMKVGATDTDANVDMGPMISPAALNRVESYLDIAAGEGAEVRLDGRRGFDGDGFLVGPCIVDRVDSTMRVAREEVFGPVLSVIRADDLETAIAIADNCEYGNGASIFTNDGYAAREFKHRFNAGMLGINVGVPAPMAWFPFTGCNQSFFGELHIQGMEGIQFYTRQKVTMTRWFSSATASPKDPVWAEQQRSAKS